jgi:hypothetical protein
LREPVGRAAIVELVQAFVDAWRRESADDLTSFLSQSADTGPIEARGRGREAIIESWNERLKAHVREYAKLQGDLVATDRIQFWDLDDAGDVYVSAPMRVASSGPDRLFGRYLTMVLRREGGELRIIAYGETDERSEH